MIEVSTDFCFPKNVTATTTATTPLTTTTITPTTKLATTKVTSLTTEVPTTLKLPQNTRLTPKSNAKSLRLNISHYVTLLILYFMH